MAVDYEDVVVAESSAAPIILTAVWDKDDAAAVSIAYSSVGWGLTAREDDGSTVILSIEPVNASEPACALATDLSGRSTFSWTPGGLATTTYRLDHFVVREGVTNAAETLHAYFSFANNPYMRITDEQIIAAMTADSTLPFSIVNDGDNPWAPISLSARDGSAAPADASSVFDLVVDCEGTLSFEYKSSDAQVSMSLDGAVAETLDPAADWSSVTLTVAGRGRHVLRFTSTVGPQGTFALKNVRWIESDVDFVEAESDGFRVDLRPGVRMPKRYQELLPFVYSPTNFTGCAGADETSRARVSVVQVTGDEEAGIESWTNAENEVAGTLKVLKASASVEGAVEWTGATRAIRKATFEIRTGGDTVYTENAFFDLRKYHPIGMLVIIR